MGDLRWLTDLGPAGLLSLFLALIIFGVWVPRWVWRREADRADRAERAAQTALAAVGELTAQVKLLIDVVQAASGGTGRHRGVD